LRITDLAAANPGASRCLALVFWTGRMPVAYRSTKSRRL
jgi:hypothetical protein